MIIYFHLFASSFMSVFQWIHDVDVWLFECKLYWIMWSCESVGKMLNYRFGSFDSINSAKNVLRTPDIHYHYQSMMKGTEKWRENEKKTTFSRKSKSFDANCVNWIEVLLNFFLDVDKKVIFYCESEYHCQLKYAINMERRSASSPNITWLR